MFLWNSSYSEEEYDKRVERGINEAQKLKNIYPFIQPILASGSSSKSVWGPCAKVISLRSDEELESYLFLLFEWLQDMNWPGADIIYERLLMIPFTKLELTLQLCRRQAVKMDDHIWLCTLDEFERRKQK